MRGGAGPTRRSVFPRLEEVSDRREHLMVELASTRQRLGLSQTKVASRMGTSQPAVARLESGLSDARLSTLERYATALGAELRWTLTETHPHQARRDRAR